LAIDEEKEAEEEAESDKVPCWVGLLASSGWKYRRI